jgi:hypothetical protein
MHMIGHDDGRVKFKTFSVIVYEVLKNHVARMCRKRLAVQLSKCHEDCPVGLLVMRQAAVIVVVVGQ